MKNYKLKSMVVGCGKIGSLNNEKYFLSHANAYKKNRNFELLCGVDINKKNRDRFKKLYKCKSYTNLEKAIKENKPDIISVCTPDKTHFMIVNKILSYYVLPKIIFLEKPCFENLYQLSLIKKLAKVKKVEVIINHSKRFDHNIIKLKNFILKKRFGKINSIYSTYYSGWLHNAIHAVDLIIYIFNSNLKIIEFSKPYFKNKKNIDAHLRDYRNNFDFFINSVDEKKFQYFKIDFFFENSLVSINNFGKEIFIKKVMKNKIGEKVLKDKNHKFGLINISPINNALDTIYKFSKKKNKKLLKNYSLDEIQKTMKQMWSIKKNYENRHKK